MQRLLITPLLILLFVSYSFPANAQYNLDSLYQRQLNLNQNGMKVLGGWALGNIAVGSIMSTQTEGANRYFHLGNATWNGVNLILAGAGYLGARRVPDDASFGGLVKLHENAKRSLLFNAGIDLAYTIGGFWMLDVADRQDQPEQFTGLGASLVMQGLFLFTFDVAFYLVQERWGKRHLQPILNRIELTGSGLRIQLD
jgi:hypothetical protein